MRAVAVVIVITNSVLIKLKQIPALLLFASVVLTVVTLFLLKSSVSRGSVPDPYKVTDGISPLNCLCFSLKWEAGFQNISVAPVAYISSLTASVLCYNFLNTKLLQYPLKVLCNFHDTKLKIKLNNDNSNGSSRISVINSSNSGSGQSSNGIS